MKTLARILGAARSAPQHGGKIMSENFKTIVIGTSLTELSDGVVRTAAAIARHTGATPWLVHAYLPPPYCGEMVDGSWVELQAKALHDALEQQAHRTGLAALPGYDAGQLRTLMGSPPWGLVGLARQVKADLLVVGAAEGGAFQRIVLGSTADGAIRKSPCPVLVVRSAAAFPPARVEVPVDLSPLSARAFRRGLSFLAAVGAGHAETEALLVLDPLEMEGSLYFTGEQIERFAGEELRRFVEANSQGRTVPRLARVRVGDPRDEIAAVLKSRQVDLAILGTHGRSGLDRLTMGSVAAEVLHQAPCNLLVVPPESGVEATEAAKERASDATPEPATNADWTYASDEAPVLAGGAGAVTMATR
jgi:universal stress protein E